MSKKGTAIGLLVVGAIILFVGIGTAVSEISNPNTENCSYGTIKRQEQIYADPNLCLNDDWEIIFDTEGVGYAEVYEGTRSLLGTVTRDYTWKNYKLDLAASEYSWFTICVPIRVAIEIKYSCSGNGCDSTNVYVLTEEDFVKANTSGFTATGRVADHLESEGTIRVTKTTTSYYEIVVYSTSSTIHFTADYHLTYTVYDVDNAKKKSCSGGKCSGSASLGEVILVDFPSSSKSGEYIQGGGEPIVFTATLNSYDVDWSSVLAILFVVGGFGIVCIICGAVLLFKTVKKIGKVVAAAASTSSATVAATPNVVVAAPVAAQPAVAQPAYAGAPPQGGYAGAGPEAYAGAGPAGYSGAPAAGYSGAPAAGYDPNTNMGYGAPAAAGAGPAGFDNGMGGGGACGASGAQAM